MSDVTEEELERIVNSKKCKTVKISGKNYYISKKVKDELKKKQSKEGGFLFLGAIPTIIAALAGASGIAAGVSTTIAKARDASNKGKIADILDLKKKEEAEKLKQIKKGTGIFQEPYQSGQGIFQEPYYKGNGIFLNPYQATAIHKFLKNTVPDSNLKDLTKNFKGGIEVSKIGNGIYLNPYKKE